VCAEAPGENGCSECFEVRLAGQVAVERLKTLSGHEKERRGLAAAPANEYGLGSQSRDKRALKVVQRSALGLGQKYLDLVVSSGLELRLRSSERSCAATFRVASEFTRSFQEGGGSGETATTLGPFCRALEVIGQHVIGTFRSVGPVPDTTIRVRLVVGRVGQRPMDLATICNAAAPVRGRANERMTKAGSRAEVDQLCRSGGSRSERINSKSCSGAPQQGPVADRFGCRGQQQCLCVCREGLHPTDETVFDLARERAGVGKGEATS
jgi:hypothetical protein